MQPLHLQLPRLALVAGSLALAALPLAGCDVGSIGGGSGDDISTGDADTGGGPDASVVDPPTPDYRVSMTPPTIDTQLATEARYTITLDSTNFTGTVDLAATGVPDSWTALFSPTTVTVPLDGQATAELVISVPANAEATTASIAVAATASPGTRSATAAMTVTPDLTLEWVAGTGNGPHGFPTNLSVRLGTHLHIRNGDNAAHRVHSDGGPGFPHQDNDMLTGQEYVVTPGDVGGYRFYCHDHGDGTGVTNLTVQ